MRMKTPHRRLAIFDCDGTLVDGQGAVCAAMERAFAAVGAAPPDRRAIRRIVGLSLPQAVARLAPDRSPHDRTRIDAAYREAFRAAREDGTLHEPLFDGVAELLGRLRAKGWLLGVATGKSDRGLASCLAGHDLHGHFATLQTADRHPSKPNPAMLHAAIAEAGAAAADTVMIGDTVFDIAAARAAGVRAIGVAWGYHEAGELLAAGAEGVAGDTAELERMLDE